MSETIREYSIDYTKPKEAATETLKMHIDTLVSFRNVTPQPEELEWEIRLYEFMLEDPEIRLKQYSDVRYSEANWLPKPKREVVRLLGWDIK